MLLTLDLTKSLYNVTPQLTSILLTTILVCSVCILYNKKIRLLNPDQQITGWLVLVNWFVRVVEGQIISTVGRKKLFLTPYLMYIYSYIFLGSIISLVGIESMATSYTITLSMAFVTWIMIYFYGLKYQKLMFFKKFLNPTELISQFVPLISLSFRLFGNMMAGAIILGLGYAFTIGLTGSLITGKGIGEISGAIWNTNTPKDYVAEYKYTWTGFDIGSIILFPFLHMYFDLFDGFLQSLVFVNLSLSYWAEQIETDNEKKQNKIKKIDITREDILDDNNKDTVSTVSQEV